MVIKDLTNNTIILHNILNNAKIYVGYRMFFHDRARGEAECEIMKKTFYNVGYNMVWLLTYFQIFFKTESSSFSEKLDSNFFILYVGY